MATLTQVSTHSGTKVKTMVFSLVIGTGLLAAAFVYQQNQQQTNSNPKSSDAELVTIRPNSESEYLPNQLLVELTSDDATYLKQPGESTPLGQLVATYGQPTVKQTFKNVGETSELSRQHFDQTLEKFPDRTQRAVENAPIPQLQRFYTLTFSSQDPLDVQQALVLLADDQQLASVSPNYLVHVTVVPTDPYFGSIGSWGQTYRDLWGLQNIRATNAWNITTGSGSLIVGVLDTGLDYTHPDIIDNLYENTTEASGTSGVDDDGNGYVDDIYGYDFAYADSDPADDYGHGSHVAGTIAATGNNATGIVGVMWDAQIISAKALDSDGSGSTTDIATGIQYLTDQGASVINMSIGGSGSSTFETAIQYAYAAGVVLVASAGNDSSDTMTSYPAAYNEVIAVAASAQDDTLASFSNNGPEVDVAAPGGDDASGAANNILSLSVSGATGMNDASQVVGSDYYVARGTSMASPHVAGVVGLLLSDDPTLSVEEIRQAIRRGADDVGDVGWDMDFGYGRLNAIGALTKPSDCEALITNPINYDVTDTLAVTGYAGGSDFRRYRVDIYEGVGATSSTFSGTSANKYTAVSNGALVSFILRNDGPYTLRLNVYDAGGRVCGQDFRVFQYSKQDESYSFLDDNSTLNQLSFKALAAGDVNNDGLDDLLIGAPNCDNAQLCDIDTSLQGKVFLVYGEIAGTYSVGESIYDTGIVPVSWLGESEDLLGLDVDLLNLDGDVYEDVVIGMSGDGTNGTQAGGLCIFLGSQYASWTTDMDPTNADYCFFGEVAQDYLGYSIDSGDFDADGLDDIVTSACGNDTTAADYGKAYILYAQDASSWTGTNSIDVAATHLAGTDDLSILCEPGSYDTAFGQGMTVASLQDFNGDAIDDVAIGNYGAGSLAEGAIHVFYGASSGITSATLASADVIISEDEYHNLGEYIAGVGDVNADGISDVLVGHGGEILGAIYGTRLFLGSASYSGNYDASAMSVANWSDLGSYDYGNHAYPIGDIDADGINDMAIGQILADAYNGMVSVYLGNAAGFTSGPFLLNADFVLQSDASDGSFLGEAITAGDFDGDGDQEVVAAAPSDSAVYVFDLE